MCIKSKLICVTTALGVNTVDYNFVYTFVYMLKFGVYCVFVKLKL